MTLHRRIASAVVAGWIAWLLVPAPGSTLGEETGAAAYAKRIAAEPDLVAFWPLGGQRRVVEEAQTAQAVVQGDDHHALLRQHGPLRSPR